MREEFKELEEKNPNYSTFILFGRLIKGRKLKARKLKKWFDELITCEDRGRYQWETLKAHFTNLNNK